MKKEKNNKNELTIELAGQKYTAAKPKARLWKKFVEFDENKSSLGAADFIEAHAEMLAEIFPDLDKDFILDNIELDDILVTYFKAFTWITGLLTSKLSAIKNADGGEA